MKEVRCNEWDCPHNKRGKCTSCECPNLEEALAEIHGRKENDK